MKKIIFGALIAITVPLSLASCRSDEMTAEDATEFASNRLDLSDNQSASVRTIANSLFAEKDNLKVLHKAVNDEIYVQMKSETADARKLESVATNSLQQFQSKIPLLATNFASFHETLTPEQRIEIVEKIEKNKKSGKRGHWGKRRHKDMTAERATKWAERKLDFSPEQSNQFRQIADTLFANKNLATTHSSAIFDEVFAQMKSETADAQKLATIANNSLNQLLAKLPLLTDSFAKFHSILNAEQRAEIVEKMEDRRENAENGNWRHWH